ncbi:tumor necrosis factor receptor superfamily member 6B-like [Cheilinus undulatus]|uniref:tumor necrosis factor receptor superfamily member 6B-like n=1 Tax=Cheilinus undulatus TaxID=241271 RepID=UPI001BD37514|nr:tumor necrosis factor receptor superfamily member 6B-like [Cheilinus undulatus]XP_041664874.1 tumor necrosis factor receptor superfamily member 6B-like [Cheilinus undulatus]
MLVSLSISMMFLLVVNGEPPRTFRDTDPRTGRSLECDRCPPGMYLQARCTETQKSVCAPCPEGSFTELWNYIGKCLRCGVCGHNQVVKTKCTAERDCQCECRKGYYYKRKYEMCLSHSECPTGHGVLTEGTAEEDTVCQICPNGTFSDTVSTHENCTQHKSCHAPGLMPVLRGSTWHDSVCMSCSESASKDGADYLREIIPSFFTHQKMPVRRLRQILRKLPTENGKRHEAISSLQMPELLQRINAWVASSPAEQIRQLPTIVIKTGANNAGERLQSKLQRIDSQLAKLCDLNNEVDAAMMTD